MFLLLSKERKRSRGKIILLYGGKLDTLKIVKQLLKYKYKEEFWKKIVISSKISKSSFFLKKKKSWNCVTNTN